MAKAKTTKTKKTTVKKVTAVKKTTKTAKPKTARKPNAAFMKPKKFTEELAEIVGKGPLPRTEITKKLWVYIKKYKLQDPKSPRMIIPDEKLSKILGKKTVDMFKMTALVGKHILD